MDRSILIGITIVAIGAFATTALFVFPTTQHLSFAYDASVQPFQTTRHYTIIAQDTTIGIAPGVRV